MLITPDISRDLKLVVNYNVGPHIEIGFGLWFRQINVWWCPCHRKGLKCHHNFIYFFVKALVSFYIASKTKLIYNVDFFIEQIVWDGLET